jgi:ABC-type transport system involved in multi-copper enzyme maturation permease subunit
MMSIKEQGYTHWDGELAPGRFPWKPITRYGIKLTFKRKFFKPFFFMTLIPAVVFLAGIFISERIQDFEFMIKGSSTPFTVNPGYFYTYFTSVLFMIVLILVFAGSGLISDDLKHNALQLYFSRPLKKKDFFTGKVAVIVFFLFIITLVPGLILFIMKLVFSGSFQFVRSFPWLPLSIIGFSVFITGFFACYALFLSALSKNRRYVSIMIFGLYIFSDILFGIFYGIFRKPYFCLLSIKANLQQVGKLIFSQKPLYDVSPWYSILVLCLFCFLAVLFLSHKVRGVEIVK